MLRGTGAEMWRVRTMRTGRPRARSARAASQESVELCALSTSQRLRFSHSTSPLTPSERFPGIYVPGWHARVRKQAVRFEKDQARCQRRPLVAIDEGMIAAKIKKVGGGDLHAVLHQ